MHCTRINGEIISDCPIAEVVKSDANGEGTLSAARVMLRCASLGELGWDYPDAECRGKAQTEELSRSIQEAERKALEEMYDAPQSY